jgi:DNA-binding NtrC family response regulator
MLEDPQEPKVDAILLDHWLPGEAGTELIREIRATRPDLPLLIMTAQTSVAVAVDAMRAGASDFLVKPIAPERLLAALNAATDRRQRNGELRPLSEKISKPLGFEEIVGSAPVPRRARHRRQGRPRPRLGADRGRERLGQGSDRPGDPRRLARAARSR